MTITPAYGRDYKSIKAVKEDFYADKDFILNDVMSPWDGKPINRSQLKDLTQRVQVRYGKLRKTTMLEVK